MEFSLRPRRSLMIYVNSLKPVKSLRRYGRIHYVSRKMRYVILYIDEKDVATTTEKLKKLRNVKKIVPSHWPDIDPELTDLELTGLYKKHDEDEKE